MPPANTPADAVQRSASATTPQSPPAHRPLTPLSYLDSPVADLAATLYTHADADEANAAFLRASLASMNAGRDEAPRTRADAQRDSRRTTQATSDAAALRSAQETAEDLSRRERLQRVLSRLNRLHDPAASGATAYSNRTPSPHRQDLYDWAPQQTDGAETPPPPLIANDEHAGRQHELADRRERLRDRERRRRENEWVSLRARAAIQRARFGEGSPSATDRMLRYVMDRERSGTSDEEERARGSGWFRPTPARAGGDEEEPQLSFGRGPDGDVHVPPAPGDRDRERQERVDAFRRGYLAEHAPNRLPPRIATPSPPIAAVPAPTPATFLENALKYLSELRGCEQYEDSLAAAMDHGLATKEFFADKHDDFIMDLGAVDPLPFSSWLQPGTVFDGHQHASSACGSSGLAHPGRSSAGTASHVVEQINPNFASRTAAAAAVPSTFDHPPGSTRVVPFDAARPWLSHHPTPPTPKPAPSPPPGDHWPVRVTLHVVDTETMTVQGTMEAYDVPSHPSHPAADGARGKVLGRKTAPITTYLEGHIIDSRTHSFLTPSPPPPPTSTTPTSTSPPIPTSSRSRPPHPHHHRTPYKTSPANATPYTTHTPTPTFPSATPASDATNWALLPPFSALPTPATFARTLLSQTHMRRINAEYIFMRWKERNFVHRSHINNNNNNNNDNNNDSADVCEGVGAGDQERGHGLTIGGFYYVSLRRGDGRVEGLYFDPGSTPFQCLRLGGKGGGGGVGEMR
ncbi:hypothetical protein LTR08_003512 [Meristemomyces frigidus]|nr:hypothetical protein LTR08_003512 [Meristemomyces frigidus]